MPSTPDNATIPPEARKKKKKKLPETIKIDPNGDLLLVVGPRKIPVLVSSHCFKMASKVFDAMLRPNFQEGVGFSNCDRRQAFQLELPDDDAQALTLLARFLHFRGPAIDTKSKQCLTGLLTKLLFLCDKYDCVQAIYYYATTLASSLTEGDSGRLVVAYLLDNPGLFASFSRDIILGRPPLNSRIQKELDPDDVLPAAVWVQLEKAQRDLWMLINDTIVSCTTDRKSHPYGLDDILLNMTNNNDRTVLHLEASQDALDCEACIVLRPLRILGFQSCLARQNLWPVPDCFSINAIVEEIEEAASKTTVLEQFRSTSPSCKVQCACKKDIWAEVLKRLKEIETSENGLCLDCLTNEKRQKQCRRPHFRRRRF